MFGTAVHMAPGFTVSHLCSYWVLKVGGGGEEYRVGEDIRIEIEMVFDRGY